MAESNNRLLNELCGTAPDGEQWLQRTINACKSLKRKRIPDNGIQTSSDAKRKRVATSTDNNVPELSNKSRSMLSSNTLNSSGQEIDAKRVAPSTDNNVPELSNKSRSVFSSITLNSSGQEIECGGDSVEQFKADALSRLMRGNTATKGRKRSQLFIGLLTSCPLKRSKRSSSAEKRPSSIDDLPDGLLVEILCRLPCNKFVFQSKCVCKRWRTIIEFPYFVGRFVNIQSYKRTPKIGTLISRSAEEFPIAKSSPKLLTVLRRSTSFNRLRARMIVVATYNDLVLCCQKTSYNRTYYICHAYTMEWVALPPAPRHHIMDIRVGFICDIPDYYNCEKDDWEGHKIQLNGEYKFRVVRIVCPNDEDKWDSSKFIVEIFSSETGEWRESVVSFPKGISFMDLSEKSFAYNGRLYWPGALLDFLGLDPFNDNNSTSSSKGDGIIDHKIFGLTLSEHVEPVDRTIFTYLGVCGGCVRMCDFCEYSRKLYVWEFKEQDHDHGMVDGAAGKLCLSEPCRVYSLDPEMYSDVPISFIAKPFDPENKDTFYLRVQSDILKCNILTGKCSKIAKMGSMVDEAYFPVVLPWWPTPVPRLPQPQPDAHGGGTTS